jgi:hypothetical protein
MSTWSFYQISDNLYSVGWTITNHVNFVGTVVSKREDIWVNPRRGFRHAQYRLSRGDHPGEEATISIVTGDLKKLTLPEIFDISLDPKDPLYSSTDRLISTPLHSMTVKNGVHYSTPPPNFMDAIPPKMLPSGVYKDALGFIIASDSIISRR